CKKIACSHRHASTAGMGILTRTAIGIINKTERHKMRREETKRKNRRGREGKKGKENRINR
ncbi:MAG: hypothetical protein ACOH2E_05975, partial [Candidatus Paracaedibacter sp.]